MSLKITHQPDPRGNDSFPHQNLLEAKAKEIREKTYDRKALAKILEKYNQELEVDAEALKSIESLKKAQSICIVTGQQLGFMGGPSLLILKALTAIHFAKKLGAIPILWLATEDHDIGEIDHTFLLDSLGNLKRYKLSLPKRRFVEDLILTSSHLMMIDEFLKEIGNPKLLQSWKPKEGDSYAKSMARYLALLFQGTGLLFVEPKLLRPLGKELFKKEIIESEKINQLLQKSKLQNPLLHFSKGETNLFFKNNVQERVKIKFQNSGFLIGENQFSEQQILETIENDPERFSTNVASRPIFQNLIFPTVAYVAGPHEESYHQQLVEYHQFHQAIMPIIVPRLSATILPPKAANLLEKANIKPWSIPQLTSKLQEISPQDLHYLHNLIHPQKKQQERVLNWWEFQASTSENLIQSFLKHIPWTFPGHYYCMMQDGEDKL